MLQGGQLNANIGGPRSCLTKLRTLRSKKRQPLFQKIRMFDTKLAPRENHGENFLPSL